MGDQCLWRKDGVSELQLVSQLTTEKQADGGLIGVEVPMDQVQNYGVIAVDHSDYYRTIVEKPKPAAAPSNLNNASIYLLPGEFMDLVVRQVSEHKTAEYYVTDVVNEFVAQGHRLVVRRSDAAYLDCGTLEGWVTANSFLLTHQSA